ncbi:hypothetical protein CQZ94_24450 [Bacillus sp. MYb209]|nr:hypothetical protein CQZ94_24450 [Bacillus sp. MYb209]
MLLLGLDTPCNKAIFGISYTVKIRGNPKCNLKKNRRKVMIKKYKKGVASKANCSMSRNLQGERRKTKDFE